MSKETFQELRSLLMEKLDLARELSDKEILEQIDELILTGMRDSCLSSERKGSAPAGIISFCTKT